MKKHKLEEKRNTQMLTQTHHTLQKYLEGILHFRTCAYATSFLKHLWFHRTYICSLFLLSFCQQTFLFPSEWLFSLYREEALFATCVVNSVWMKCVRPGWYQWFNERLSTWMSKEYLGNLWNHEKRRRYLFPWLCSLCGSSKMQPIIIAWKLGNGHLLLITKASFQC